MKKKKQLVKHYNNVIVAVVIFLLFPLNLFWDNQTFLYMLGKSCQWRREFQLLCFFAVITVNNSEITVLFSCYFWLIFLYK